MGRRFPHHTTPLRARSHRQRVLACTSTWTREWAQLLAWRARVSGGAGSASACFLAAAYCAAFRVKHSSLALGTFLNGVLRVAALLQRVGRGSLADCLGCHGGDGHRYRCLHPAESEEDPEDEVSGTM